MADVFTNLDMIRLLQNKSVLFVGDSNIRNLYKDFVCLYQTNELMDIDLIGRNLEESYLGDTLLCRQNMYKQRAYVERRLFETHQLTLEFMFVTHCLSPSFIQYLKGVRAGLTKVPDVICMNSFIWDFTRWGPKPEKRYVESMYALVEVLNTCLPRSTLFIWITTCPISNDAEGIPFVTQLADIHETLFSDILEGNCFAAELFRFHGYDVIDTHQHLFRHTFRRSADGITYLPCAIRYVTYLLLTHLALSWDVTLPGRIDGTSLHDEIARSKEKYSTERAQSYWFTYSQNRRRSETWDTYNNTNSPEGSQQSAESTTEGDVAVKTPLIRVKATWEVLEEFGKSTSDNLKDESPAFNLDLPSEQYSQDLEPINSPDSFTEIEEGEITTSDLCKSNDFDKSSDNLNINKHYELNEENTTLDGKHEINNKDGQTDQSEGAIEEGEIVDENILDQENVITNWLEWKSRHLIRDSRKDLVTLEIPSNERGTLKLKTNNYQHWCNNRGYNDESLYRIEGFIKQLKRKLITSKKMNRKLSKNCKKLLFGYEKNERHELFRPKVTHTKENSEKNGSNIDWVAEQWRQVIQGEPNESVEILNYWQRRFQNEESEKDATKEAHENFVASKKIERRRCSISFL
uniref:Uncharacterized protein n=1 Tax=Panstrongylus lignarius TaxID=156445 RepID=A0A224X944_9HEMI